MYAGASRTDPDIDREQCDSGSYSPAAHVLGRGVCKVLTVLTLLELSLKRKVHLRLIVSSKFMAPTGPEEKLMIELRREVQSGTAERVKALFKSADKKIAEILIEVNYE